MLAGGVIWFLPNLGPIHSFNPFRSFGHSICPLCPLCLLFFFFFHLCFRAGYRQPNPGYTSGKILIIFLWLYSLFLLLFLLKILFFIMQVFNTNVNNWLTNHFFIHPFAFDGFSFIIICCIIVFCCLKLSFFFYQCANNL